MPEQTDIPHKSLDKKDLDTEKIYHDQRSVALRTTQSICFVQEHDKMAMLVLLLAEHKTKQAVIVIKSKKKADALNALLTSKAFNTTAVHGNHRQETQQEVAEKFNLGTLNIIITTDMIFKTLTLENIGLVVSYDLPDDIQTYYNRLAYMKEQGVAIALVSPEDEPCLSDIEYNMKKEIEEKVIESFVASPKPSHTNKTKKDRTKKPRHRKNKIRKEQE